VICILKKKELDLDHGDIPFNVTFLSKFKLGIDNPKDFTTAVPLRFHVKLAAFII